MISKTFIQQFRVLLWKNFVLKIRRPISTSIEILIPICVAITIMLIRNLQTNYRMDQCYLKEKQMDSLGPLPFLRDFICTIRSTCYTQPTTNTTIHEQYDIRAFLDNITYIYMQFSSNNMNTTNLLLSSQKNSSFIETLNYTSIYTKNIISPFLDAVSMQSSNNLDVRSRSLNVLASYICGSSVNDFNTFIGYFPVLLNSRSKRSLETCKSRFYSLYQASSTFGTQMYLSLAPLLFGKIFFTPNSTFTRELVKRANISFVVLDSLRLSAIQWRLNFRDWIYQELTNSSWSNNLRNVSYTCLQLNLSQYSQHCASIINFFNVTNVNPFLNSITRVFSFIESILECVDLDKFVAVDSPSIIDNFTSDSMVDVFAGLVFHPTLAYLTPDNASFLNYTIRMSRTRIDSTTGFKVLDKFWSPFPRTNTFTDMKYYTSGFILLQEAIDRAFIEMVTGNQTVDIGTSMQIMPIPCFVNNGFIQFATNIMPFIFLVAWLPIYTILVKSIVYEKEKRLKEFMYVMGLSHSVHWLAWSIASITMTIIPNIVVTLILTYRNILEFSSPAVVFMLFFSYSVSFISQAFMITVFFNKANVAAVVAGLLYFALYVPSLVFVNLQDSVPSAAYIAAGILSQVSFSNGLSFVAYLEQGTEGAQFGNLFQSAILNVDIGVGHCIIMLWVDACIYLLITLYVEEVFPGQYGIPKSWYFFVTRRYWWPRSSYDYDNELTFITNDSSSIDENHDNNSGLEALPKHLKIGISIRNLTKKFSKMSCPSVDNLSLDFYQSQITAFLGHNGAGKTTTISMLTGIFPPTSGTAYIFNEDIRTDIDSIRKVLGLCPQHNILFDNLTVEDHIYFYGLLRGMSSEDIRLSLGQILEDVGLTKKRKTQSNRLSGGMKRKLSVALAFIGDSKAVFLDEPTAGVDPFARRGIWDLLIKHRGPNKAIILTTHHMDEADYLSDRIAIISKGKLKCCGSSVFLKRHFGEGYYLILVKSPTVQNEDYNDSLHSISGENVFKFVKKHLGNAMFFEETMTQVTIILPVKEEKNNDFSILFQNLDASLDILNMTSYGLSDTSLEDVFLKVADDPSDSIDSLERLTDGGNLPRPKTRESFKDRSVQKRPKLEEKDKEPIIDFELLTGFRLFWQQFVALQIKKIHNTKRNVKGLSCELILPLALVAITVGILRTMNPFSNQPNMIIHPWLMMPVARGSNLNTFYRKEDISNVKIDKLTTLFRTDLGESGVRCMNQSVYFLPNFPCSFKANKMWTPAPKGVILSESPPCDCNKTGFQLCQNPLSGGPPNSNRFMASTDIVNNLTGYNLSDHLIKKFKFYNKKQYGGYQFLLPNNFGIISKSIGNSPLWRYVHVRINSTNTLAAGSFLVNLRRVFTGSGVRTNFTRIWINNKGYVSMPAYSNIFSNLLLRSQLKPGADPSQYGIAISTHPFKYSDNNLLSFITAQMYLEMALAIFVILALSIIPASFVIFLIDERVSGSKRLQFVSGINPCVYWIANFLGDILKYMISATMILCIFFAFNDQYYVGDKNRSVFVLLLYLYGFAIVPHMYPFSFLISTPSTAFVVLSVYNMIVGTMTTTVTFFLDGMAINNPKLGQLNDILKNIFLIFPQYDLGRGMLDLSLKYLSYNMTNGANKYIPYDLNVGGKKLVALGALSVFWCIVVCVLESGICTKIYGVVCQNLNLKKPESSYEEDIAVGLERERVKTDVEGKDILKVMNLTKVYNPKIRCRCKCCHKYLDNLAGSEKRKLAVNNISFGVKEGECFGLLGVNGAGKTTTFKMLTGEEGITHGEAMINGKSIINDMVAAHKNMGFCPQVDALHGLLTCEEELYFYCRIRGIRSELIKSAVESSFKSLSLTPHASKITHSLSGGNKRKLSTAISLIGSPRVVFMDEPTSGMDAGARRFLWTRIQALTSERRAVILTSHNMEECEVLCHRLAIMVNGQFKCLGSVQGLKSKFGDDYYVTARLVVTSDENTRARIRIDVSTEFQGGVSVKDENLVTTQFVINSRFKLHRIFDFFEHLKAEKSIIDFSISQATLDDVFISFAKNQDRGSVAEVNTCIGNDTDNTNNSSSAEWSSM